MTRPAETGKCGFVIARISRLAYRVIRRREGTDPWSVGTTSARPPGPTRDPGRLLILPNVTRGHFAAALSLALGRSRLARVYCACNTAIGRTSNNSEAASLGPGIALPAASMLRMVENPSANTDAFQA